MKLGVVRFENPKKLTREIEVQVGKNIQNYRLQRGFTQRDVARSLGVTYQQIQKYENATNRISASRLLLLSKILRVSLMKLFEGKEEKLISTPSS